MTVVTVLWVIPEMKILLLRCFATPGCSRKSSHTVKCFLFSVHYLCLSINELATFASILEVCFPVCKGRGRDRQLKFGTLIGGPAKVEEKRDEKVFLSFISKGLEGFQLKAADYMKTNQVMNKKRSQIWKLIFICSDLREKIYTLILASTNWRADMQTKPREIGWAD